MAAPRQWWRLHNDGGDSDGGGTDNNQQSTKSSGGNGDGNGDDDSGNDDDENEGNGGGGIGSLAAVAAARRWQPLIVVIFGWGGCTVGTGTRHRFQCRARHVLVVLLFKGRRAHSGDDHAVLARNDVRWAVTIAIYACALTPALLVEAENVVTPAIQGLNICSWVITSKILGGGGNYP